MISAEINSLSLLISRPIILSLCVKSGRPKYLYNTLRTVQWYWTIFNSISQYFESSIVKFTASIAQFTPVTMILVLNGS